MPITRSPAQQAAARTNGTRSRGPATEAGKARSARNGTRHGLRGGPFALLPDEDHEEFAALHAAVSADWSPRDAYERRWVRELVAALWRQDRLRGLEFATLAAAAEESPPSEATMRKLLTFARYGARIDKDIGRALYALRALRDRPDAKIAEPQNDTCEPGSPQPHQQNYTNDLPPRTGEPERPEPAEAERTIELHAPEPEPANSNVASCTPEPEPPALNRHQRRRLEALARKRRAA